MTNNKLRDGDPVRWQAILLPALAGAMGWGIRGQYGHETGAMIAGVLIGAAIALVFLKQSSSLTAVRVVAMLAVGISFGGSMTYGQTVGLTHNSEVVGNWSALRWGMIGLFLKGGIWIGLAGGFLGIGLSRTRYRAAEAGFIVLAMIGVQLIGLCLWNEPYHPNVDVNEAGPVVTEASLPRFYFSEQRMWYPDKSEIKPRRERWGGLLLAWVAIVTYAGLVRRDSLTRNLAVIGFIAGGIGFATGQSVQAFHAWNLAMFQQGWLGRIEPYMNWWNMMETTFGLILGGGLGIGVWLNRTALRTATESCDDANHGALLKRCPLIGDLLLAGSVIGYMFSWSFLSVPQFDRIADMALPFGLLPVVGILGGRLFPFLFALPIVAAPIAGKTLKEMSFDHDLVAPKWGWLLLVVLPLTILTVAAVYFWRQSVADEARNTNAATTPISLNNASGFARWSMVLTTWVYFSLNFAFFRCPWPWNDATSRTPNAWIFFVCSVSLTAAAVLIRPSGMDNLPAQNSC